MYGLLLGVISACSTVVIFNFGQGVDAVYTFLTDYPQAFQGVMVFAASVVASATALWIAYVAYPRQKRFDRDNDWHRDRRQVYGSFLSAADALLDPKGLDPENFDRAFNELTRELSQVQIIGTEKVASAAVDAVIYADYLGERVRNRTCIQLYTTERRRFERERDAFVAAAMADLGRPR